MIDFETRYLLDHMRQACLAGANFIEFYHKRPEELRAWAARIESAVAPNSISLAALSLRNAAKAADEFMAENAAGINSISAPSSGPISSR